MLKQQQIKHLHVSFVNDSNPNNKVHGANMGPIWSLQDPDGPHVGPMNCAFLEYVKQ